MRLELRETASIRVSADREKVLGLIERRLGVSARTAPDRLEGRGSTYVVRQMADGTQVYHMRRESAPVVAAAHEREELRRSVKADLFDLAQILDATEREPERAINPR